MDTTHPPVQVSYHKTLDLRQRILRPHQPPEACLYPGDEYAAHFACKVEDEILAILSVYPEDEAGNHSHDHWRIRGVATVAEHRKKGLASALLCAAEAHVQAQGGSVTWCNARIVASDFYRRHRYAVRGEVFEIPGIGDHYRMVKTLAENQSV